MALSSSQPAVTVNIGKYVIPLDRACAWISEYTDRDANLTSTSPFAYPAYDEYAAGTNDPDVLTDGDLLAPMLLNVGVKIRSFYGLQAIRDDLTTALAAESLATPLADLDHTQIATTISPLYAVLDDHRRPWGVNGTTLSKILHRKRPNSVVLHDRWVRACYLDTEYVRVDPNRSWADYMTAVSIGIREDLISQPSALGALRSASKANPPLSDIRLIDILAWNVGQLNSL